MTSMTIALSVWRILLMSAATRVGEGYQREERFLAKVPPQMEPSHGLQAKTQFMQMLQKLKTQLTA